MLHPPCSWSRHVAGHGSTGGRTRCWARLGCRARVHWRPHTLLGTLERPGGEVLGGKGLAMQLCAGSWHICCCGIRASISSRWGFSQLMLHEVQSATCVTGGRQDAAWRASADVKPLPACSDGSVPWLGESHRTPAGPECSWCCHGESTELADARPCGSSPLAVDTPRQPCASPHDAFLRSYPACSTPRAAQAATGLTRTQTTPTFVTSRWGPGKHAMGSCMSSQAAAVSFADAWGLRSRPTSRASLSLPPSRVSL